MTNKALLAFGVVLVASGFAAQPAHSQQTLCTNSSPTTVSSAGDVELECIHWPNIKVRATHAPASSSTMPGSLGILTLEPVRGAYMIPSVGNAQLPDLWFDAPGQLPQAQGYRLYKLDPAARGVDTLKIGYRVRTDQLSSPAYVSVKFQDDKACGKLHGFEGIHQQLPKDTSGLGVMGDGWLYREIFVPLKGISVSNNDCIAEVGVKFGARPNHTSGSVSIDFGAAMLIKEKERHGRVYPQKRSLVVGNSSISGDLSCTEAIPDLARLSPLSFGFQESNPDFSTYASPMVFHLVVPDVLENARVLPNSVNVSYGLGFTYYQIELSGRAAFDGRIAPVTIRNSAGGYLIKDSPSFLWEYDGSLEMEEGEHVGTIHYCVEYDGKYWPFDCVPLGDEIPEPVSPEGTVEVLYHNWDAKNRFNDLRWTADLPHNWMLEDGAKIVREPSQASIPSSMQGTYWAAGGGAFGNRKLWATTTGGTNISTAVEFVQSAMCWAGLGEYMLDGNSFGSFWLTYDGPLSPHAPKAVTRWGSTDEKYKRIDFGAASDLTGTVLEPPTLCSTGSQSSAWSQFMCPTSASSGYIGFPAAVATGDPSNPLNYVGLKTTSAMFDLEITEGFLFGVGADYFNGNFGFTGDIRGLSYDGLPEDADVDWRDFNTHLGRNFWSQIRTHVSQELVATNDATQVFKFSNYGSEPGSINASLADFDTLYPEVFSFSYPILLPEQSYHGHPGHVGKQVRANYLGALSLTGENLLSNGDFEFGNGLVPDDWQMASGNLAPWSNLVSSTDPNYTSGQAASGIRAIKFQPGSGGMPSMETLPIAVQTGDPKDLCYFDRVVVSARVKKHSSSFTPFLEVQWDGAAGSSFAGSSDAVREKGHNSVSPWERISLVAEVPYGATSFKVKIGSVGDIYTEQSDVLWFDDVRVVRPNLVLDGDRECMDTSSPFVRRGSGASYRTAPGVYSESFELPKVFPLTEHQMVVHVMALGSSNVVEFDINWLDASHTNVGAWNASRTIPESLTNAQWTMAHFDNLVPPVDAVAGELIISANVQAAQSLAVDDVDVRVDGPYVSGNVRFGYVNIIDFVDQRGSYAKDVLLEAFVGGSQELLVTNSEHSDSEDIAYQASATCMLTHSPEIEEALAHGRPIPGRRLVTEPDCEGGNSCDVHVYGFETDSAAVVVMSAYSNSWPAITYIRDTYDASSTHGTGKIYEVVHDWTNGAQDVALSQVAWLNNGTGTWRPPFSGVQGTVLYYIDID